MCLPWLNYMYLAFAVSSVEEGATSSIMTFGSRMLEPWEILGYKDIEPRPGRMPSCQPCLLPHLERVGGLACRSRGGCHV
jgi:hypothetical protein